MMKPRRAIIGNGGTHAGMENPHPINDCEGMGGSGDDNND